MSQVAGPAHSSSARRRRFEWAASAALFVAEIEFGRRVKRLACQQGKRIVILRQHPLITSARKVHLYSPGEICGSCCNRFRASNQDRAACAPWYDGRRVRRRSVKPLNR